MRLHQTRGGPESPGNPGRFTSVEGGCTAHGDRTVILSAQWALPRPTMDKMAISRGPAALLFDLDNTLAMTEQNAESALLWWGQTAGVAPAHIVGRPRGLRLVDLIADFDARFALGLDIPAEVRRIAYRVVTNTEGVVAVPGALELVQSLRPGEWAIVTSGQRAAALARLKAAGLPVPEVLVAAEDVTVGKPNPEGFLAAAARLGCRARHCIVVEDSPLGLRAGAAAGMRTIGVLTSCSAEQLRAADHLVDDLRGVRVRRGGNGLTLDIGDLQTGRPTLA